MDQPADLVLEGRERIQAQLNGIDGRLSDLTLEVREIARGHVIVRAAQAADADSGSGFRKASLSMSMRRGGKARPRAARICPSAP